MNILYLETGTSGGGSFESLFQTLKALDRKKFFPVVIFLNPSRICTQLESLDIKYYVLHDPVYSNIFGKFVTKCLSKLSQKIGRFSGILSIFYEFWAHRFTVKLLNRIIKRHSIEILHLNDQINRDFFALFAARKQGIRTISHLRSPDTYGFNPKKSTLANSLVSDFIAYSHWIGNLWADKGIDQTKIKVVYNAIDTSVSIEAIDLHNSCNIPSNNYIIGSVGTLIPNRGYDFLLRSFSRLLVDNSNITLVIAGGGSERMFSELKIYANSLGISDRIVFTGFVENGKEVIGGLDVFVLPYRTEALGRTLLEAWLSEVPVISTNLGCMDKIIQHGYNGMLVSYGDTESLKSSVNMILSDKQLKQKLIEGGKRTVKEQFDIRAYIKKVEEIYSTER